MASTSNVPNEPPRKKDDRVSSGGAMTQESSGRLQLAGVIVVFLVVFGLLIWAISMGPAPEAMNYDYGSFP